MFELDIQALEGLDLTDRVRLGRYRAGGVYGYVFEGEMLSMGRPVARCAVKLVCPRPKHPAETTAQDMREQTRLAHPNLLTLQQVGVLQQGPAAGWIYIVTELGEHSLQEVLDRADTLPSTRAQQMLTGIARGLAYLHHNGIVHGEVRPTNIIYTHQGWKLSGLEYRGRLGRRLEEFGNTDYLFIYKAPETFEGPDSFSSDVWSLAVIGHAALCGRLPFPETADVTKGDMMWRISNSEPEPEPLGEPFDSLMKGCLRRNPSERWSAEQAAVCLSGGKVEEAPPPAPEPIPPSETPLPQTVVNAGAQENPWPSYLAAAAVLILFVGIVLGMRTTPRPQRMVINIPPNRLSTVAFEVAALDTRGRLTALPAEAPVYKEDLGNGRTLEMIQVPPGEFDMGSPPNEALREPDEGPRHRVRLDGFYIGRYEITQAQWAAVAMFTPVALELPLTPSKNTGEDLPVHSITYDEAVEFCARLSQRTGRTYRLPTEAEWEYACRGGPSDQPFGFGPAITDQVANFNASRSYPDTLPAGQNRGTPVEVETFPYAGPWGLFQVHGNVREWCHDYYGAYSPNRQRNPAGPGSGRERVVRGGSFLNYPWLCRSAARSHEAPNERLVDIGLRVVAPAERAAEKTE